MAVQWKAGNFTLATTDTVSKAVTGVGFQPQGYMLFTVGLTSATAQRTSSTTIAEGITDGTRQYAQSIGISDNVTVTTTRRAAQTDRVLYLMNSAGTDIGSFAHSAFGADGFTISTTTAVSANVVVYYVAWAGMDNQYLDVFAAPAATGSFSRTAAGFQPDALLWMSNQTTTLGVTTIGIRCMGWSLANGTQFAFNTRHANSGGTNYSSSTAATDRVLIDYDYNGGSNSPEVTITTHDATGFTADRLAGTNAPYIAVMHFDGGAWAAGTTTSQAATGTFGLTTAGVHPEFVMLAASNATTVSRTTPFEGGNVSLGCATAAAEQFVINHHSFNNEPLNPAVTEEYTRGDATKAWSYYTRTAANTYDAAGEIALSGFISGQVTLDQTDADAGATLIGWIANGDVPAASGGVPNSSMLLGCGT